MDTPDSLPPQDAEPAPEAAPEPAFVEETPTEEAVPAAAPADDDLQFDVDDASLYAALSYMAFLVVVPFVTRKNDPFVNFHIRQGLVVLAGYVVAGLLAAWLSAVGSLVLLAILIGNLVALVQALQGRTWKIPLLGQLADKFSI